LEVSHGHFASLRALPPYGRHHWDRHFHQAFKTFAKLWTFQQDQREALTAAGLRRWEIGEIASRIGQLYYNFYLRTSETHFLRESFTFYDAIRARGYFAECAHTPALAVKQLRYQARMLVVCLLLDRGEMARKILEEWLDAIDAYTRRFKVSDAAEWHAMSQEAKAFIAADRCMSASHSLRAPQTAPLVGEDVRCALRMDCDRLGVLSPGALSVAAAAATNRANAAHAANPSSAERDAAPPPYVTRRTLGDGGAGGSRASTSANTPLHLGSAVLCSYHSAQVKFGELTVDMFRMLRACEWDDASPAPASAVVGGGGGRGVLHPPRTPRGRTVSFGGSAGSGEELSWGGRVVHARNSNGSSQGPCSNGSNGSAAGSTGTSTLNPKP
jgi:hypothetical protein